MLMFSSVGSGLYANKYIHWTRWWGAISRSEVRRGAHRGKDLFVHALQYVGRVDEPRGAPPLPQHLIREAGLPRHDRRQRQRPGLVKGWAEEPHAVCHDWESAGRDYGKAGNVSNLNDIKLALRACTAARNSSQRSLTVCLHGAPQGQLRAWSPRFPRSPQICINYSFAFE